MSFTRFEKDYVHVTTMEGFESKIREGLGGRISFSTVKFPRLISESSIDTEE